MTVNERLAMTLIRRSMALLIALLVLSPGARAWDGAVSGTIFQLDGTSSGNYAFRVYLTGGPSLCGPGSPSWAYLNDAEGNYKVNVALLLLTKARGATVTLYSTKDASGYCQIGYLTMSN
jgi:hypothetical protein